MHLLFCVNSQFTWLLAQCMRSIARHPCTDGYTAHVFYTDLTEADLVYLRAAVPQVTFQFIPIDANVFADLPESDRYPSVIYERLFAAEFLPTSVERVLYLDVDTLAIGEIESLYHMDMQGMTYMACTHVRGAINMINRARLGVEEDVPYVNTGVILMDLQAARLHDTRADMESFMAENKHKMWLPDQDMMMAMYGQEVGLMDAFRYNLSDRILTIYNTEHPTAQRDVDWVRENTSIIHYCGKNKPWNADYHGKLGIFYEEFRRESRDNMQEEIICES